MNVKNTESMTKVLRAGPVQVKFADGELRYLRVGEKEIIRRVYFAVRDATWDTPMPAFSRADIAQGEDCFEISLEASCRRDGLAFDWKGRITGADDGTITFEVDGEAYSTFDTPRIGLCILYGSESLCGQPFELAHSDGSTSRDEFPHLVKPTLVAEYHKALSYRTESGIEVVVDTNDIEMRMEDQRNFGDNSFKSFTDNQFGDAQADQGARARQVLKITVDIGDPELRAAARRSPEDAPISIRMDNSDSEYVIPKIELDSDTPLVDYSKPSRNRDDYKSLEKVIFGIIPGMHLYDNDTYMENAPAIVPEVATLRSFASCKIIRIDPISMKAPYPTADMKLQGGAQFAAAWCARMVKYLALAKVDESAFDIEEAPARDVLEALSSHAGRTLVPSDVDPHEAVDAFGVLVEGKCEIRVINKTLEPQWVKLSGEHACEISLEPLEVRVIG